MPAVNAETKYGETILPIASQTAYFRRLESSRGSFASPLQLNSNVTCTASDSRFFVCASRHLSFAGLVRTVLKDMKLGISEKTVLKSFHPDALDLFNVCSSLRTVCQKLKWGGPTVRI